MAELEDALRRAPVDLNADHRSRSSEAVMTWREALRRLPVDSQWRQGDRVTQEEIKALGRIREHLSLVLEAYKVTSSRAGEEVPTPISEEISSKKDQPRGRLSGEALDAAAAGLAVDMHNPTKTKIASELHVDPRRLSDKKRPCPKLEAVLQERRAEAAERRERLRDPGRREGLRSRDD